MSQYFSVSFSLQHSRQWAEEQVRTLAFDTPKFNPGSTLIKLYYLSCLNLSSFVSKVRINSSLRVVSIKLNTIFSLVPCWQQSKASNASISDVSLDSSDLKCSGPHHLKSTPSLTIHVDLSVHKRKYKGLFYETLLNKKYWHFLPF